MATIEKETKLVGSKGEHEPVGLLDSGAIYYGGKKMSRKVISHGSLKFRQVSKIVVSSRHDRDVYCNH